MKPNIQSGNNNLVSSRTRVTISEHAGKSLDYIISKVPRLLNIDPSFISNRPTAIRFCIQLLAYMANIKGISMETVGNNDDIDHFFVQKVIKDEFDDEILDLTPSHIFTSQKSTTNLTFVETQDDEFVLLHRIYQTKGVKSNNHLVEEIIYSVSATILAMTEGYFIEDFKKTFSLKGFGDLHFGGQGDQGKCKIANGLNNVSSLHRTSK
ncbi:MAG: hypothetical protein ABW168_14940 [Sedimenticola sp.]